MGSKNRTTTSVVIPYLMMLLFAATIGHAAEPPAPPSSVDAARFRKTYAKWQAANAKVKRLEAQAYAKNPQLQVVENDYVREQAALKEEDARDRNDVLHFLDARKNDPSVLDHYKDLMSRYSSVYLLEVLSDPEKASIMRAVAVDDPDFLARLTEELKKQNPDAVKSGADPQEVWTAYCKFLLAHKPDAEAALNKALAQYHFPRELEAWARGNARSRIDSEVFYGLYLEHFTPPELKKAREEVKGFAGLLTELWPKWSDAKSGS